MSKILNHLNLVSIGYNRKAYAIVYEALYANLARRIREDLDVSDRQKIHNQGVDEIIQKYLTLPEKQYSENPVHCEGLTEELASAYLLSRFIGSLMNADRKNNFFKGYFSNNWPCFQKFLKNENLTSKEKTEINRHIGKFLFKLDYRKILNYSKFKQHSSKKDFYSVNLIMDLLRKSGRKTNSKFKSEHFEEDNKRKLFVQFARGLLEACLFIDENHGAKAYLQKVDIVVTDNSLTDIEKVRILATEVDEKVKGFGSALSRDFFKDMGYGIFSKPDRHVMDLIRRLNLHLFYEWGSDEDERASVLFLEIAKAASTDNKKITANQVDKIFWLLKSGNFHLHDFSKKYPLQDAQSSEICMTILKNLQSKGICKVS